MPDAPAAAGRRFPSAALSAAGVTLLALLLRLLYLWQVKDTPYFQQDVMDAGIHDGWARDIAAGRPWQSGVFFRAPLYPWFLGTLYDLTGSNAFVARVVQAVIGALSCGLVTWIARRFVTPPFALAAGVAAAGSWVLIFFDGELLIPVLAIALNLLALEGLLAFRDRLKESARLRSPMAWATLAGAGIALGLSAIARPNVLLFAPVAFFWLAFQLGGAARWRGLAIYTAAVILPIAPITLHNVRAGDFVLVSSQAGVNLWIGNNPQADGMHVMVPGLTTTTDDIYEGTARLAMQETGRNLTAKEVSAHYGAKTRAFMAENPGRAAGLLWKKAAAFWTHREIYNNKDFGVLLSRQAPWVRWLPFGFWLIGPLGIAGLGLALFDRRAFPLAGFVLAYWVSVVPFFVNARFRLPVVPVLIVLAALAVCWSLEAWAAGQTGRLRRAAGGLVVGLLAVGMIPAGSHVSPAVELERLGASQVLQGDEAGAIATLREAVEADPAYPSARRSLAAALDRFGRGEEALTVYEAWVRETPADLQAWSRLATLAIEQGRTDLAREAIERALPTAPTSASLNQVAARLELADGRIGPAWERARTALAGGATLSDESWVSLVDGLTTSDAAAAVEAARLWTMQSPGNAQAWIRRARVLTDLPEARDPSAAAEAATRAVELTQRKDMDALHALALARAVAGDWDGAVALSSEAMQVARRRFDDAAEARHREHYRAFRARRLP